MSLLTSRVYFILVPWLGMDGWGHESAHHVESALGFSLESELRQK